jgi:glutathione S-transferase
MAAELVIMGLKGSPFVRKVQVVLAEKGVDYEMEMVSPFPAPAWYLEINPIGRIPVLRDRSVGSEGVAGTIPDSSAICAYIERKHPEPALYPKQPFEYGRALWIEEYCDSELAGRIGAGIFRPLVMSKLMGKQPDVERARKALAEDLPPLFDYLEKHVSDREFLIGGAFSIADISLATQLGNFVLAGAKVDDARWPGLAAYVGRIHARPSFAACLAAERKILPASEIEL